MVEFKNSGIRSNALDGIFRKTELSRQKCLDIGVFCQGMSPDDSITAPSEKGLLHRWSGTAQFGTATVRVPGTNSIFIFWLVLVQSGPRIFFPGLVRSWISHFLGHGPIGFGP